MEGNLFVIHVKGFLGVADEEGGKVFLGDEFLGRMERRQISIFPLLLLGTKEKKLQRHQLSEEEELLEKSNLVRAKE